MTETSFNIFDVIPRDYEMISRDAPPNPKPRARIDPIFADLGEFLERAMREHYPELVDKLIKE